MIVPLMAKDKRLMEASWWKTDWGGNWVMLSKSLIQFPVDGQGCVPSILFDLRPNYGGSNEDNGIQFSQFSGSVVSNSLQLHELQHARPPCSSPTPRVHPNSCPSSQWCHPAISSLVVPFSSCPQSFPASGSFPMSQFFVSDGQSIRVFKF